MPFPPAPHPFVSTALSGHTALRGLNGLQGLTILAVEDSRFASDALRLMCQRSGARLRRAEGVEAARSHLSVYQPDVVLIDLGLPDGRGEDLIRSLITPRPGPVLIGMSGDPEGRALALAAGAMGFIDKPIPGLLGFQQAILALLPDHKDRAIAAEDTAATADPMALRDDLATVAAALRAAPGPVQRAYLSGFLGGIARQTSDTQLGAASQTLAAPGAALEPLAALLQDRLARTDAFAPPD
ncbi:response regulator [Tabrizicola sp.]|uniref:response regulator n=1 Tax=Tabrizicola sp. TaxID=2005166 RepID=UPI00286A698B|nr:response regulator [Tabrizicola sp.]